MLRAVSSIYIETQTFELFSSYRRDVFKLFRTATTSSAPPAQKTVLTTDSGSRERVQAPPPPGQAPPPPPPPAGPPPPFPGDPPRPPLRRAWTVAAAAVALTASIGGVYFYRRRSEEDKDSPLKKQDAAAEGAEGAEAAEGEEAPVPAAGDALPAHVEFLLVGGGTASFAAMRALRSARPDARVLIVGAERALPYMRPPLSKELWREPALAAPALTPVDQLSFRQWNGKRRPLAYEPAAFYSPAERLAAGEAGAAAARGWRVTGLDVARREATLEAAGGRRAVVRYDRCLLATGARARRLPALRPAADAGLALTVRSAEDAARLARALERPGVRRVVVVGGGFLGCELSAALAARLRAAGGGAQVALVFREEAPLAGVLPRYLAAEAARRLRAAGVALLPRAEVAGCALGAGGARLALADGRALGAQLVVECVGAEPEDALGAAAGLERDAARGGLLVNAELAARGGVWAAGDVASFHDPLLGRRRLEHHDHAVASGRLAGHNMAAPAHLQQPFTHQSMFWSDLGPDLGYEAIGLVDSSLRTVGVFYADADAAEEAGAEVEDAVLRAEEGDVLAPPREEGRALPGESTALVIERDALVKPNRVTLVRRDEGALQPGAEAGAGAEAEAEAGAAEEAGAGAPRLSRGVVFYLRGERVVGVLLWNLFNRMQLARQVLAQGEFEDLFEVGKLFTPHED